MGYLLSIFGSHHFNPRKGIFPCLKGFIIKDIIQPFLSVAERAGVIAADGIVTVFEGIHIP